jgi:hypothetical protein
MLAMEVGATGLEHAESRREGAIAAHGGVAVLRMPDLDAAQAAACRRSITLSGICEPGCASTLTPSAAWISPIASAGLNAGRGTNAGAWLPR